MGHLSWGRQLRLRVKVDRCFAYKIEPSLKELGSLISPTAFKEGKFPNNFAVEKALNFLQTKLSDEGVISEEMHTFEA